MRHLLILALLLAACAPSRRGNSDDDDTTADDDDIAPDDDDATADDDDSTADDDDSIADDDDSIADDDDSIVVEGCPPDLQEALDSLANWTIQFSCASASLSVGPADESVRLAIQFQLWNGPPVGPDSSFAIVFAGDPEPKNGVPGSLVLQSGENLFAFDCTDVIWEKPIVEADLAATEGVATLSVTEWNDEKWWSADVSISGVLVEGEAGFCELPEHTWTDISFGWLPG